MESRKRIARMAGALFLVAGLGAPFSLLYVPGKVTVRGDAAATARNILEHEGLFELNILAHLWSLVFFMLAVMMLYRLLGPVGKSRAALMVALALVSLPLSFLSVLADVGILVLLRGGDFLVSFERAQIEALAYFLLIMRGKTLLVAQIFWGLWLLPFAMLIMRSRFLPHILGVLLIPNGIAYPLMSLTGLFFSGYYAAVSGAMLPALLGEVWVHLWLILKGTRDVAVEDGEPTPRAAS